MHRSRESCRPHRRRSAASDLPELLINGKFLKVNNPPTSRRHTFMKLFLTMTKPSLLSSLLLFGVSTTKSSTTAADQRQPPQARFGRSMHTHSSETPPLQRIREVNNVMSPKATLRIIDDGSEPTTLRHRRKLTNKPPMFSDVLDAELEAMSLSMSMSLPSSFDFNGDVDMPSIITTDPISAVTPSSSPGTTTLPPTSEHSDETHYVKIMVSCGRPAARISSLFCHVLTACRSVIYIIVHSPV